MTEDRGYIDGKSSGQRVPREPDEMDIMVSGYHGADYQRGFLRGLDDATKEAQRDE